MAGAVREWVISRTVMWRFGRGMSQRSGCYRLLKEVLSHVASLRKEFGIKN